jgi:fructose-specific component phosphotransferase system IIB-like protein
MTTTPRSIRKVYLLSDIVEAMKHRHEIEIIDVRDDLHIGMVNGIQVEDGSGHNFLVTLVKQNGSVVIFIKAA